MSEQENTPVIKKWAALIDLDFVALDGLQLLKQIAADALANAGTLTDALFVRFFLDKDIETAVGGALAFFKKEKEDVKDIADGIKAEFKAKIATASVQSLAKAIIKKAAEEDGEIVTLSSMDTETSAAMLTAIGLTDETACIEARNANPGSYSTDVWTRAMRMAGLAPRYCIALTATAKSARGALMANVKVAAVVSPMTEFLDFAGVDIVRSATTAADAKDIIALVAHK